MLSNLIFISLGRETLTCWGKTSKVGLLPGEGLVAESCRHLLSSCSEHGCKAFLILSTFSLWHVSYLWHVSAFDTFPIDPITWIWLYGSSPSSVLFFLCVLIRELLEQSFVYRATFPISSSSQSIAIILSEFQFWEHLNSFKSPRFLPNCCIIHWLFFYSCLFFRFWHIKQKLFSTGSDVDLWDAEFWIQLNQIMPFRKTDFGLLNSGF